MSKGYIYILSNPAMPGLLKIGKSMRGGDERAEEIFKGSTGVPLPFCVEFEVTSQNIDADEAAVHEELQAFRVNRAREFFRVELPIAIASVVSVTTSCFGVYVSDIRHYFDPGDAAMLVDRFQMPWPDVMNVLCEMTRDEGQIFHRRFMARRNRARNEFYGRDGLTCDLGGDL